MKKVLFIDRDGTLIIEPPVSFQIDSLEKLDYYPGIFRNLYKIRKLFDYEIVMVSNQDGLGTSSFPTENFNIPHNKMLKAFQNEDIYFDDILIDSSMPEDKSPNRKPRTGMLKKYLNGNYDLKNSYVIGDRLTDIELAKNIGAKGILLGSDDLLPKKNNLFQHCSLITNDWNDIFSFLDSNSRKSVIKRKTGETDIIIKLSLDGNGNSNISTGLGFFDHMLEQISRHSGCDLEIKVKGDLNVDEHHTIEDTAIVLGEAWIEALGNKRGIERYGFCLPMDDCLAQVALDFGGRNWCNWNVEFKREIIGDMPTEMFYHFFKSFSDASKCNLNIKAEGENEHHKIEAIFKAFAKSLKNAIKKEVGNTTIPSSKGVL